MKQINLTSGRSWTFHNCLGKDAYWTGKVNTKMFVLGLSLVTDTRGTLRGHSEPRGL